MNLQIFKWRNQMALYSRGYQRRNLDVGDRDNVLSKAGQMVLFSQRNGWMIMEYTVKISVR